MTTADWIKRRRELLDDATDGPWTATRGAWGRGLEGPEEAMIFVETFGATWAPNPVDADVIADARTSLPLALDALDAVLTRHQPIEHGPTNGWVGEPWAECWACQSEWPCPTVDAIDTALRGES